MTVKISKSNLSGCQTPLYDIFPFDLTSNSDNSVADYMSNEEIRWRSEHEIHLESIVNDINEDLNDIYLYDMNSCLKKERKQTIKPDIAMHSIKNNIKEGNQNWPEDGTIWLADECEALSKKVESNSNARSYSEQQMESMRDYFEDDKAIEDIIRFGREENEKEEIERLLTNLNERRTSFMKEFYDDNNTSTNGPSINTDKKNSKDGKIENFNIDEIGCKPLEQRDNCVEKGYKYDIKSRKESIGGLNFYLRKGDSSSEESEKLLKAEKNIGKSDRYDNEKIFVEGGICGEEEEDMSVVEDSFHSMSGYTLVRCNRTLNLTEDGENACNAIHKQHILLNDGKAYTAIKNIQSDIKDTKCMSNRPVDCKNIFSREELHTPAVPLKEETKEDQDKLEITQDEDKQILLSDDIVVKKKSFLLTLFEKLFSKKKKNENFTQSKKNENLDQLQGHKNSIDTAEKINQLSEVLQFHQQKQTELTHEIEELIEVHNTLKRDIQQIQSDESEDEEEKCYGVKEFSYTVDGGLSQDYVCENRNNLLTDANNDASVRHNEDGSFDKANYQDMCRGHNEHHSNHFFVQDNPKDCDVCDEVSYTDCDEFVDKLPNTICNKKEEKKGHKLHEIGQNLSNIWKGWLSSLKTARNQDLEFDLDTKCANSLKHTLKNIKSTELHRSGRDSAFKHCTYKYKIDMNKFITKGGSRDSIHTNREYKQSNYRYSNLNANNMGKLSCFVKHQKNSPRVDDNLDTTEKLDSIKEHISNMTNKNDTEELALELINAPISCLTHVLNDGEIETQTGISSKKSLRNSNSFSLFNTLDNNKSDDLKTSNKKNSTQDNTISSETVEAYNSVHIYNKVDNKNKVNYERECQNIPIESIIKIQAAIRGRNTRKKIREVNEKCADLKYDLKKLRSIDTSHFCVQNLDNLLNNELTLVNTYNSTKKDTAVDTRIVLKAAHELHMPHKQTTHVFLEKSIHENIHKHTQPNDNTAQVEHSQDYCTNEAISNMISPNTYKNFPKSKYTDCHTHIQADTNLPTSTCTQSNPHQPSQLHKYVQRFAQQTPRAHYTNSKQPKTNHQVHTTNIQPIQNILNSSQIKTKASIERNTQTKQPGKQKLHTNKNKNTNTQLCTHGETYTSLKPKFNSHNNIHGNSKREALFHSHKFMNMYEQEVKYPQTNANANLHIQTPPTSYIPYCRTAEMETSIQPQHEKAYKDVTNDAYKLLGEKKSQTKEHIGETEEIFEMPMNVNSESNTNNTTVYTQKLPLNNSSKKMLSHKAVNKGKYTTHITPQIKNKIPAITQIEQQTTNNSLYTTPMIAHTSLNTPHTPHKTHYSGYNELYSKYNACTQPHNEYKYKETKCLKNTQTHTSESILKPTNASSPCTHSWGKGSRSVDNTIYECMYTHTPPDKNTFAVADNKSISSDAHTHLQQTLQLNIPTQQQLSENTRLVHSSKHEGVTTHVIQRGKAMPWDRNKEKIIKKIGWDEKQTGNVTYTKYLQKASKNQPPNAQQAIAKWKLSLQQTDNFNL